MTPTQRDFADFYRFGLENSHSTLHLVQLSDAVAWVDGLIVACQVPDEWMLELSLAKTCEVAISTLSHVPLPRTEFVGVSILVAHIHCLWLSSTISRDDVCHLLWNLRNHLRPEHDVAAIVPEVTLEDAVACLEQGEPDLNPFTRVDEALIEFFAQYEEYAPLIPV